MTVVDSPRATDLQAHPRVTVLADRCAGCQECVVRCPTSALSMDVVRWVAQADDTACVGCRQCVRTCPFSAIEVAGAILVADRAELRTTVPVPLLASVSEVRPPLDGWDEALAEAERCLACPDPTCVRGCPAHNDIPGFIAAVRERDLAGAHDVLARTTMLPDVCARVCDQSAQCEGACTWSLAGGVPVAIGALERFVADHREVPAPALPAEGIELSVGIVGSGPAGMAAAWELAQAGAQVTVYERAAAPGGLLAWGIPAFTLPAAVAARPWDQLEAAGVELWCNSDVGPDELDGLLVRHDGVILAHGAGAGLAMPVPGAELVGVEDAGSFLHRATEALAARRPLAELQMAQSRASAEAGAQAGAETVPTVLVVGAGNTAMDVARSARRLGAHAVCVDWMDRRFAPVRPDELTEAEEEGVEVRFSTTLVALEGTDGRVRLARLAATRQAKATERPTVLAKQTSTLGVDLVVMAMGFRTDARFAALLPGTPLRRQPTRLADRRVMASGVLAGPASAFAHHHPVGQLSLGREVGVVSAALPFRERLWAAGDALVGPSTVVEAMAQGRRAAQSLVAARPRRPGRPTEAPQRLLVCYESRSGRTERAARVMADALSERGVQVRTLALADVDETVLAWAQVVVVGTWVEGLVVAKVGPAAATRTWLAGLPQLGGKPVAVFCTYAVAPKATLSVLAQALAAKGAHVVAEAAFPRGGVEAGAPRFAGSLATTISLPPRSSDVAAVGA